MSEIKLNLLGLDLGQQNDPSAFVFLQRSSTPMDDWLAKAYAKRVRKKKEPDGHTLENLKPVENPVADRPKPGDLTAKVRNPYVAGDPEFDLGEDIARTAPKPKPVLNYYECRQLRRWPLGTSYVDIVHDVKNACNKPIIAEGRSVLVVDNTGVGRPISDMFRRARMPVLVVPVTITAGRAIKELETEFHVPKLELVSLLTVMLEGKRIVFDEGLPLVQELHQELRDFKMKITAAANATFGAEEGKAHDDLVLAAALALFVGEKQTRSLKVW